jgi:hypothetical protein
MHCHNKTTHPRSYYTLRTHYTVDLLLLPLLSSNFSHYKSHVLSCRSDVLRFARKFLVNEQISRSSPSGSRNRNRADCLMEVEVEPYRAVLDNAMSVVELQGTAACRAFNIQ